MEDRLVDPVDTLVRPRPDHKLLPGLLLYLFSLTEVDIGNGHIDTPVF